jgi:hypothetical protein
VGNIITFYVNGKFIATVTNISLTASTILKYVGVRSTLDAYNFKGTLKTTNVYNINYLDTILCMDLILLSN